MGEASEKEIVVQLLFLFFSFLFLFSVFLCFSFYSTKLQSKKSKCLILRGTKKARGVRFLEAFLRWKNRFSDRKKQKINTNCS
jgi:hypothetical protein